MDLTPRTISHADGPHLLILAGVHGDEFEPMAAVGNLWCELQGLHVRGRITLLPVANQPAFLLGQRTAEDGLDLARTLPGRSDGSVTEQVAAALTPLIRQADYLIDLHTGGRLFRILPLAGYMLHPEAAVLDSQRAMARAFNLPILWGTTPRLEGRTLSVARDAGIPSIYVEAGGGAGFDPGAVELCVTGCLNVAGALGLIERESPTCAVEHIVEDGRDESGHLQVQHPAPVSGWYEPLARPGDRVAAGEPLGRIANEWGEPRTDVAASEGGLVLFQRAVPGVAEGESVGGVLGLASC